MSANGFANYYKVTVDGWIIENESTVIGNVKATDNGSPEVTLKAGVKMSLVNWLSLGLRMLENFSEKSVDNERQIVDNTKVE
jgi:hypothetical protein